MNNLTKFSAISALTAALCASGCGKKTETVTNQAPPPVADAPVEAKSSLSRADSTEFTVAPVFDPSGGVNFNSVDSFLQQGLYDQAVLSVMTAQKNGKGTVDDSLKLQRKMQDIQADVIAKAASGDARAMEAMRLLRKTAPSGGGR